MRHQETAWIPMCIPDKGKPWFFSAGIRDRRMDAIRDFEKHCCMEWKALRIEGWRVVRVRLDTNLH